MMRDTQSGGGEATRVLYLPVDYLWQNSPFKGFYPCFQWSTRYHYRS